MAARYRKITALQLYYVIIISIAITNHVLLIPVLLHYGKRDSWVGAGLSILPTVLWVCLVYLIIKRSKQQNLLLWIGQRYGNFVVFFLKVVAIGIAMTHATITMQDMVTWTHISYLPRTPPIMISLAFMIFCFFAAREGIRAIAITSGILLPVVVLLGYFVMGANFQYKDYSLLTPLFTHGYGPALKSMYLTSGSSFELLSIVFLQHHADTRIRLPSLIIVAACLVGLTVGPLIGAIAIFGPFEADELRYPAFEQWRMVTLGKYISHLDFLSIFQWISGACIRMSMLMFLTIDVLMIQKKRTRTWLLIGMSLFFVTMCLLPVTDNQMVGFIQEWYYPMMFVTGAGLLLVLLVLIFLPMRRKENVMK
ncbi:endospore germination permease [Paenibacillus sp. CGMCC 1.16610]|uniref:Endospore germination permease n=1 Tax=Paenibacillus anseongense TaxID=2682845 RepID=A0ABW9U2B3_9BACL|nr:MULTISPECIES: endospore germination permease [Paenibacillus]MBA2943090.1 endospore germination permease [Paenibacillus sp. CGMCC 1.16610]MVQ33586.1 endospore germination permease [Paenibacillus anseongense]